MVEHRNDGITRKKQPLISSDTLLNTLQQLYPKFLNILLCQWSQETGGGSRITQYALLSEH